MEDETLQVERREGKWEGRIWGALAEEVVKVSYIAVPMVAVTVMQYLLQVVSVMMVGHLGELSLSSVAIATSLTNVTGFSLLSGLVGGLETLCGQAYGAQQYRKVGTYTYSAIISLILACLPICLLWIFIDKFLILIGQDPSISLEARKYAVWLIPSLFGGAILKPLVRYLQSQSLILPMLASAFSVLCFHVPVCWAMVFKLGLGSVGAAMAVSLSTWLNVALLGFYVKHSETCKSTRVVLSKDAFLAIGEFFGFAVPSAVMVCLKWWSLEVLILLSGLLPNPKLETSVLSICLTISTLHFTVPYGIGAAASTRVSNELGAGNPKAARTAVVAVMILAVTEMVVVGTGLFCSRYVLGYAYSNEKQVVNYIAAMTPLICLSIVTDSLQAVISGIARGSGWQHIGAYVNLGAFYLVGMPVAVVLCFVVHLRAKGLWIGIVIGSIVQSTILSLITAFTDWKMQVTKAKERLFEGRPEQRSSV
ncbi:protein DETOXIFICATION 3-like [Actinidia eriantha]|uniref:protein DETOXIFICATION 3-like n=1 Tax=Actinidia eriantha TaxID=165200 RepID=UPI00258BC70E|nr:protein DETOXIFICATION 3-like [Actinidia eriantha]